MNLIESIKTAADLLQQANRLTDDWRVRNSIADAATLLQCALFIQEKLKTGAMKLEPHPPNETWRPTPHQSATSPCSSRAANGAALPLPKSVIHSPQKP
jgi:hypothetical protein